MFRVELRALLQVTAVLSAVACNSAVDDADRASRARAVATTLLVAANDAADVLSVPPTRSSNGIWVVAMETSRGFAIRLVTPPEMSEPEALQIRRGDGPGEARELRGMSFGPGDTLWLLDGALRLHALSPPPDMHYVRTSVLPHPTSAVLTERGALSAPLRFNDSLVPPELVRYSGEAVRFGVAQKFDLSSRFGAVAISSFGGLWLGDAHSYQVALLDSSGAVKKTIGRLTPWFPKHDGPKTFPWLERPLPQLRGISEVQSGLLAVLIARAAPNWAPQQLARSPAVAGSPVTPSQLSALDHSRLFEYVVEVFDISTGKLVRSRVVEGKPLGFTNTGELACLIEREGRGSDLVLYSP